MHSFYVPYYILDILVRVKYTGEVRKTIHNLDGELDYRWNRISCSRSSAYNDVISIACSSEEKYYDVMSRIKFNEDSFNDNSTGIVYKIVQGFSSILGLKKSTNNIDLDIEAEDIPQLPFIDWRICLERKKNLIQEKESLEAEAIIQSEYGSRPIRNIGLEITYPSISIRKQYLPMYVGKYFYDDDYYHFAVNGRTGEIDGDRPESAIEKMYYMGRAGLNWIENIFWGEKKE